MIEAILVIGWRSDIGAYLVDIYPEDYEVDPQDLTNIFKAHRMAANGIMERAVQDFNYIRLFDGRKLVSWYSGFRTTNYLSKPNFCGAMILSPDENPNKREELLHVVTYNILEHLEDPDFMDYLAQLLEGLNEGFLVEPEDGYPGLYDPDSESFDVDATEQSSQGAEQQSTKSNAEQSKTEDYEAEFDELLALAEDQSAEPPSESEFSPSSEEKSFSSSDPFGSSASSDPFSSSSSSDPFSSSSSSAQEDGGSFKPSTEDFPKSTTAASSAQIPESPEAEEILAELNNLDRTMPKKPTSGEQADLFNYLEKKVAFLESKINSLSKLVGTLQRKEIEIKEKNEVIAKLLALLS